MSTALIETAVHLLLEQCDGASKLDGVGFNKFDAMFARDVWHRRPWTPAQLYSIFKMLKKYTKQLQGLGVDLTTIPAPPNPQEHQIADGLEASAAAYRQAQASKIRITPQGDEAVAIYMPWNPETLALVKAIPGRSWDGINKRWLVTVDDDSMEALKRFAEQVDAVLPSSIEQSFALSRERREKLEQEAREGMADSLATDADFVVEGLGMKLFPFQRAGVKYASKAKRCLIADEMGLGKTVQGLATVHHLNAYPVLVVCPASLRLNWLRESMRWLRGKTPTLYERNAFGDVCVINYDILTKYKEHILARGRFKSIIFDEFHNLKNHKAQRSVAARHIAASIHKAHGDDAVILGLTGTPVLNRPGELLHLLQVLGRLDDVGGFKNFRDRYLAGDWKSRGENLQELQQMLRARFLIRREKSQVLKDLPAKQRVVVDIDMKNPVAYKMVEDKPLEDHEAAAIVRIGELRREAARQKLEGVREWVQEFLDNDKKLILFASHRDIQQDLIRTFPDCVHILGDDDASARQRAVDRFQERPDIKLIVLSLKAGGVGLTLTAASDVAFVEFGWTPGDMDQAEDRAHRIGQRDSVTAWYLKATSPEGKTNIDDDMLALINEKRDVSARLLSEGRALEADSNEVQSRLVQALLSKARKEGRLRAKGALQKEAV